MTRIAGVVLIAASAHAAGGESAVGCPLELPAAAVKVKDQAGGWTGFVPERFVLSSAGVTLGPLEHTGVQLGERQPLGGKRYKMLYPYLKDWKEEKWLTCHYGDGGLVLARPLPKETEQCSMLYTPDAQGGYAIDVVCK